MKDQHTSSLILPTGSLILCVCDCRWREQEAAARVYDKEEAEAIEAERGWQLATKLADESAATAAVMLVSAHYLFIIIDYEICC